MKCPHCLISFHATPEERPIGQDLDGSWALILDTCPECERFIFTLASGVGVLIQGRTVLNPINAQYLVRPKTMSRTPPSKDVPPEIAADYIESCLVLADSPKASAALSRRCLQLLLRGHASVTPGNLFDEIQQVIDSNQLPSHLVESIDAIRNIGNFAAHPIKSTSSGEILQVKPGEADWNLDVLESLFDFYFVQPEIIKRKREALNAKLYEADKPEMK